MGLKKITSPVSTIGFSGNQLNIKVVRVSSFDIAETLKAGRLNINLSWSLLSEKNAGDAANKWPIQ